MKKKSRFLTGLLSAVMALSLCALPASAAGTQTRVPTLPAIDTDTTGTLTIHKYEYNGNVGPNGTGEATDINGIPTTGNNAATPLDGVTFTLYKVMDADKLQAYYENVQENANDSVTIDTYVKNNAITRIAMIQNVLFRFVIFDFISYPPMSHLFSLYCCIFQIRSRLYRFQSLSNLFRKVSFASALSSNR